MEMDFQVILTKHFIASCKLTIGNRFTELSAQHNIPGIKDDLQEQ